MHSVVFFLPNNIPLPFTKIFLSRIQVYMIYYTKRSHHSRQKLNKSERYSVSYISFVEMGSLCPLKVQPPKENHNMDQNEDA